MRLPAGSFHPDLREAIAVLPQQNPFDDIAATRAALRERRPPPATAGVQTEDRVIDGPSGAPLTVRIYRPVSAERGERPAVVWIHGGGFALGDLGTEDAHCRRITVDHQAIVVSVDYRLAPEHPYPAGFQDCQHVLEWVIGHDDELQVDLDRIALAGHSAGAALAFMVAAAAKDRGGPRPCFVYMGYPVLDDRQTEVTSSRLIDPRLFDSRQAETMWNLYLGATQASQAPHAVPARITDLTGLPPIYTMIGTVDPGRDDLLALVGRLIEAEVPVEVHLVPGAPHMFDAYGPGTAVVDRAVECWSRAMGSALAPGAGRWP